MNTVYEDEDAEMQDYDVDMLARQLESRLRFGNVTDGQHIRGVSVIDLIDDNAPRIPWSHGDCIVMTSHAARHQLHKGNCGTLWIDQLIARLGMAPYARDQTYRDILVRKLTAALIYLLHRLNLQEHIIMSPRKPHAAVWKPHTAAWGEEGWDGDESRPWSETDDATATGSVTSIDANTCSDSSLRYAETGRSDDDSMFNPNASPGHGHDIPVAPSSDGGLPSLSPSINGSRQLVDDDPFAFNAVNGHPVAFSRFSGNSSGSSPAQHSQIWSENSFDEVPTQDREPVVAVDVNTTKNDGKYLQTPPQSFQSKASDRATIQPPPSNEPQHATLASSQKAASLNDSLRIATQVITPNDSVSCQGAQAGPNATPRASLIMQTSTPSLRTKMAHWLNHDGSWTARSHANAADEHNRVINKASVTRVLPRELEATSRTSDYIKNQRLHQEPATTSRTSNYTKNQQLHQEPATT
ncbi:hypothetical protein EDB81DRAFT_894522 [Dactylonectria macrodidyma]|uniref:Uncharacterized protein n=1 Tax=Dactylonectria macrodidyma TaxID=307937 RepID=A0A9P9D1Y9_9HYPO|nr:hypothetical protein EDB81DRAFT_894522 [Dactylonectria macrodidyma]